MLRSLSKAICDCRAHATYCEEKAESAFTEDIGQEFLRLRESWLNLAHSYEFAEQRFPLSLPES
jgi:hypothetical protein